MKTLIVALILLGTTISFAGLVQQKHSYIDVNSKEARLRAITKTQGDFNLSNRFRFELGNIPVGEVVSVRGGEIVDYKDGESNPSRIRGRIVILRDLSKSTDIKSEEQVFYKWRKAVLDGKVDRRSISVIFLNDRKEEVRINLGNCLPVGYSRSSAHASEKLEIVYETMELK